MTTPLAQLSVSSANARFPATYESAKAALANCVRLDECKDWADKAAALASYAKQANDEELMKQASVYAELHQLQFSADSAS